MQDKDFDMRLNRAECPVKVAEIVEKTIRAVYPHYYPSGTVQFFLNLHGGEEIDIGGRMIKVFHTPGHSPGHMCFWEPFPHWKRWRCFRWKGYSRRIIPWISSRMRDAFQELKGSGTFDYGDWAVWL